MKFDCFDIVVYPTVYPPAEDTYLLYDNLELSGVDTFLEIGCGTGVVTLRAAQEVTRVIATDLSLDAVKNTNENLQRNRLDHKATVIQCDLLTPFRRSIEFSVIAWNPPYLPRGNENTTMDHALVGGREGVESLLRLIPQIPAHLKRGGSVFFVVSSLGRVDAVIDAMERVGFRVEIIAERGLFFERLLLLRGTKS